MGAVFRAHASFSFSFFRFASQSMCAWRRAHASSARMLGADGADRVVSVSVLAYARTYTHVRTYGWKKHHLADPPKDYTSRACVRMRMSASGREFT